MKKGDAERLMGDAAFVAVCHAVRADTLEALARADVDDTTGLIRLQQRVLVIEEFQNSLEAIVHGDEEETDPV